MNILFFIFCGNFIITSYCLNLNSIRTVVSVEMMNVSFRQKIMNEVLNEGQIIQHTPLHHTIDYFYIGLFFTTLYVALTDIPQIETTKEKFKKKIYISKEIERNIEIFFIILMTLMTRNIENAL